MKNVVNFLNSFMKLDEKKFAVFIGVFAILMLMELAVFLKVLTLLVIAYIIASVIMIVLEKR